MGKLNLTEAAKSILEGSKETFDANIKSKQSMRGQGGSKGEVGMSKPNASVAYGSHDAGFIGDDPNKTDDSLPDYLKGTPRATPPGATPPVGSEKDGVGYTSPKNQPQQTMGRKELTTGAECEDADSYDSIRDRKKTSMPKQTMMANKGATFQAWEETDPEDEDLEDLDEGSEGVAMIMAAAKKAKKMNMKNEAMSCDMDDEDDEDDKKEKKEKMKMKMKKKMEEDVSAMLHGEDLSEEFVSRAATIFEAAVIARSEEYISEATSQLVEQFEEAVETVKEEMAGKIDKYLDYIVKEWMHENQLAVESGLRSEIVEDFMGGLRNLFVEHFIDIPEEKVDVVEELTARIEELEESLNSTIVNAIAINEELNELKKNEAIYEACEGLTQTQVEKIRSLAEGVEFTTEEEFSEKLAVIKESYIKTAVKTSGNSVLDDEVEIEEEKKVAKSSDPLIEQYAKTISQTMVK